MDASALLSEKLKQLSLDGRHLTDDSKQSEKRLNLAMDDVVAYTKQKLEKYGGHIEHRKQISLYDCQKRLLLAGGACPEPNERNKGVFMKPDGGIIYALVNKKEYPILVVEDKVQGTNDILFAEKKKRQAIGNAIERAAKNLRGAEMLFSNMDIFPYIIFASGCDFHSTETIGKRLEMMNFGYPNHQIDICSETQKEDIEEAIDRLLEKTNISKKNSRSVAPVFIKAHKWDEMAHGSSHWATDEYKKVCFHIIDLVIQHLSEKEGWESQSDT